MKIATHNGNFHADDIFALAALSLIVEDMEIVRTRDVQTMEACDLRLDVGGSYDPSTGDFDHHQAEGAGTRANGIKYATFGLIWKEYGFLICKNQRVADYIDWRFVQNIDANDNGQNVFASTVEGVYPGGIDRVIALMNPTWKKNGDHVLLQKRFHEAIELAKGILEREIEMTTAALEAEEFVREQADNAADERVIIFDRLMPWRETVIKDYPNARFVLYPTSNGWAATAIPVAIGDFTNRMLFPADWAGLSGKELVRVCGVEDALFCHRMRFFVAAKSKEACLLMVSSALEQNASPNNQ